MPSYEVLIYPEYVDTYMDEHGADSEDISTMYHRFRPLMDSITPEELITLSIFVLDTMSESAALQKADDYGCDPYDENKTFVIWSDDIIGHVADEILDKCSRTVLDF